MKNLVSSDQIVERVASAMLQMRPFPEGGRAIGLRTLGNLHFPNDLARVIHNADVRLLDRYVQSSKMVHAALHLLMLEAIHTDYRSP